MRRSLSSIGFVCALGLALWGCEGGGVSPAGKDTAGPGADVQDGLDVVIPDGSETGDDGRADPIPGEQPDGEDDVPATDPGQDQVEEEVVIPGGLHWPCDDPADCNSNFCIDTMNGMECTIPCASAESCPIGWLCTKLGGDIDAQYACVDPAANLCRPCEDDQDCATASDTGKNLCIEQGPEGRFCGRQCGAETPCPAGFDCVAVGADRDIFYQCRPAEGAPCPCTKKFQDKAYKTVCFVENALGRCLGERTCDADCDAPAPVVEVCNNKDDDCDGTPDDDVPPHECTLKKNEYGTCKGTTLCVGGTELCEGTPALPEACNGKDDDCDGETDEGFPDTDGDGIKDCMESDIDGDGVMDGVDNCKSDWNPVQEDCNQDGVGDACDIDDDHDGVKDGMDNCRCHLNQTQENLDGDELGDACDCDIDGDGVMNDAGGCEPPAIRDNCTYAPNPEQLDLNKNGIGDACDDDMDGDGVKNIVDNCPAALNPDQANQDLDGFGDACDCDIDGDGVANAGDGCPAPDPGADNCTRTANPTQADGDEDGIGDACDCDADGDGIANPAAGCEDPRSPDNCPGTWNPDQTDANGNGIGDECEDDWDGDDVPNADDNCAWTGNPGQEDLDGDGQGDACDCDIDGDAVDNEGPTQDNGTCPVPTVSDNCPSVPNPGQEDLDLDGVGDHCDPDRDGDNDPNDTDCAPDDPLVFHGQMEQCNGHDDNCNGLVDEQDALGCSFYFYDEDADGFGTDKSRCLCAASGLYTAAVKGDCADTDAQANPSVAEVCNGKDDDCDGQTDEQNAGGCTVYYRDIDNDKFGLTADARCLCAAAAPYTATAKDDCSDTDETVFPGASEKCNGKDDDCDGTVDEESAFGCSTFYKDGDRDGYGLGADTKCLCIAAVPYDANKAGDCDDTRDDVNPAAQERCNQIDDNCNQVTDEDNALGCTTYYLDADRDGTGVAVATQCKCSPKAPYDSLKTGDCNDNDSTVFPGATEVCNQKDDDCDTLIDEEGATGCDTWYLDNDGDGYGSAASKCLCNPTGKYTSGTGDDCADGDKNVYPGATEACNQKDDDCDGLIDEEGAQGCVRHYLDEDHDGFGNPSQYKCLCGPSGDYTSLVGTDCDDTRQFVYPGAIEVCQNSRDDNCNGHVDEEGCQGCSVYYLDLDRDGYGQSANSKCLSAPTGDYTAQIKDDCNDSNKNINPGATEVCNGGVDDDCNGVADGEDSGGCTSFYNDVDGDNYGVTGDKKCLCLASGTYRTTTDGDCNDADKTVFPNAVEACNGKDDNCRNGIDEEGASGCQNLYADADHDSFGAGPARCLCKPEGLYTSTKDTDCNDGDATINPAAIEKCNGGVDDNCDGKADVEGSQGCSDWFYDADGDTYGIGSPKCLCAATAPYRGKAPGDCNDNDATVFPGAVEKCNSKDDDCDTAVDEPRTGGACGTDGYQTWYTDKDGDGYGTTPTACLCAASGDIRTTTAGDCNDTNAAIKPGAKELCDGLDNNCSGAADEDTPLAMCGSVLNGAPQCTGGQCVAVCTSGYFNTDQLFATGCECSEDGYGLANNSCDKAYDLGNLAEGGAIPVNGRILPDADADWFKVSAKDTADSGSWSTPGRDKMHFKVTITSPGSAIKVAVLRGSCADTSMCSAAPRDVVEWFVDFKDGSGATAKGEDPCITESATAPGGARWDCCKSGECQAGGTADACCGGASNNNTTHCTDATKDKRYCRDDSATYYLKVYRTSGSASKCDDTAYSITLSN
ncbi:MAG: thrombospondin type 3 repeat-containing protein [Deltaproteobacteria bacterium]|nr:thrombospondin type 3 repeat-containing protein [Deltaproteobacteria bacterium]